MKEMGISGKLALDKEMAKCATLETELRVARKEAAKLQKLHQKKMDERSQVIAITKSRVTGLPP